MAQKATIDATVLGIKKPIEINETIGIFEDNLKFQIKMAELQEVTDETTELEFLKNQLAAIEAVKDYIKKVLNLSAAETKKFTELSREEIMTLGQNISAGLMHLNETVEDGEPGKQ